MQYFISISEHECNINKITCNTSFQYPIQKKDVSTINDSVYYEPDEQVDTISDSNKQVDPRINPMVETHIVDRVRKLSVGVRLFKPAVIGVIGNELVSNVLENSRVDLSLNSLSPLNMNTLKVFMIGSAFKSVGVDRSTISCTPPDRTTWNHSRIGTPGVNEGVFIPSRGKTSSLAKWTGNIEPSDTSVHVSATQEKNSYFLCIEKEGVKSLPETIVADLYPSIWVNLANSVFSERPKFKSLRLPTVDATYIRNLGFAPSTRANSLNRTRRDNFMDSSLGYMHDFERMSRTKAYRNHIKNSELETREVFERETENIPHTQQTDLMTTLNENPLTRSTYSSTNEERHKPEVNIWTQNHHCQTCHHRHLHQIQKKRKRNAKIRKSVVSIRRDD